MNINSWNVRGATGTDFRTVFREMVSSCRPDLFILTETRLSDYRANSVISSLGFERFVKVDAMGFSWGIWVLWNPHAVLVEPISSAFHELFFKVQVHSYIFILTALYASPTYFARKILWNKLAHISINLLTFLCYLWGILMIYLHLMIKLAVDFQAEAT